MTRAPRIASIAFLVSYGLAAHAQQPYLVRDLNPVEDHSASVQPRSLRAGETRMYFFAEDPLNAVEIWRSEGTAATTRVVGDLVFPFGYADGLAVVGDQAFGAANEVGLGTELRVTDGTVAGTHVVLDINPGPSSSDPAQLVAAGAYLYFNAEDGGGRRLWRSDGTPAGTIGLLASEAFQAVSGPGAVFFTTKSAASGSELWRSEGTPGTTSLVKDVCPGPCSGWAGSAVRAGDLLYFVADDGVHGNELWRSDGTEAGTTMVADLNPGPNDSRIEDLEAVGATLYFSTSDSDSVFRVEPSGTPQPILQGFEADELTASGSALYFVTQSFTSGRLWKSDGTAAGTHQIVEYCTTLCTLNAQPHLVATSHHVFYTLVQNGGANPLWRSDGTAAGTFQVTTGAFPDSLTVWLDTLYFFGQTAGTGRELWTSDGSVAGTVPVSDYSESPSFPRRPTAAGDRLFLQATGADLWVTEGTAATTNPIDISPVVGEDAVIFNLGALGRDALVENASPSGLWRSDGTPGGTQLLAAGLAASGFYEIPGASLFTGGVSGNSDLELWRTDGTPAGTALVADLVPGGAGTSSLARVVGSLAGQVFVASGQSAGVPAGLWRTNGTTVGTTRIGDVYPAEGVAMGNVFLFAGEHASGRELWRTDGTAPGTFLVKDVYPGPQSSAVQHLVSAGTQAFFVARSAPGVSTLWRTDGTTDGTVQVPGAPLLVFSRPVELDGVVYFVGDDGVHGDELWRSDGTLAGTYLVEDINPGPAPGVQVYVGVPTLFVAGGRIWLAAYSRENGLELWRSDGTAGGTQLYADVRPGPATSQPGNFAADAARLYFSADDGIHGRELFALPLLGVAAQDVSIAEGDAGTTTATFAVTLATPATAPVTVSYATADGTATAGSDYLPRTGTLTFQPGTDALSVAVTVFGDLTDEADETFSLTLSSSGPAVVVDANAVARIADDDEPSVSAEGSAVTEGDAGTTGATFTVTLTTKDGTVTPEAKTVDYETGSSTATAGIDFDAAAGAVTFPAGSASGATATANVAVRGDTVDEPDERFTLAFALGASSAMADGTILDDDGIETGPPTEIASGTLLRADLAPPAGRTTDRDDYVLLQQPNASYEVVIDEASGIAAPLTFVRIAADGTTVLQSATPVGTGSALALRWQNTTSTTIADQHLSVSSAGCGTSCGADDTYRLRAYETTLSAPRFNNLGGQGTVVVLQNTTDAAISGRLLFWLSSGALGRVEPFTVPARGTSAINTLALIENSGSLTVTHDGPYGGLVGKAVSLEPATGFSFDTPLTARPR